jgi:3-methyl-2-oxobutanoate hydroxymethyltransferase
LKKHNFLIFSHKSGEFRLKNCILYVTGSSDVLANFNYFTVSLRPGFSRKPVMNTKVTIADLIAAKSQGRKIVAVSCYDYLTAKLVAQTDIDMVLVGDSAAQLVLGFDSTLPATMDYMVAITAAVRRGAPNVCLAADMPFLSYQVSLFDAVRNAGRFAIEAGVQLIKIEVTSAHLNIIKAVSDAGMAVMAHIGMRPQNIGKIGKLKAEGTTAEMALELIELAKQVVNAGASCLLLEGVAAEVAEIITRNSEVPVIGCGSGPGCDGQILVAPDILGIGEGPRPKFAKTYGQIGQASIDAFRQYAAEVANGAYPDNDHCYHMKQGQLDKLRQMLG